MVSGSVPNGQTAACWLAYKNGVALTANNVASTMSAFNVGRDGEVTVNSAVAVNVEFPLDFSISTNGQLVYVLSAGAAEETTGIHKPSIVTYDNSRGNRLREIASTSQNLPLGVLEPNARQTFGVAGLAHADGAGLGLAGASAVSNVAALQAADPTSSASTHCLLFAAGWTVFLLAVGLS